MMMLDKNKMPDDQNQDLQPGSSPPSTPISNFDQVNNDKPSKWRYFFIVLGVLQAAGVAVFLLIMAWAIQQSRAGVSGMEFIGLFLFITVVPAVGIMAIINLLCLPIYMIKHKPHGKGLLLCVISLIISLLLGIYGAYVVYQVRVSAPKHENELIEKLKQDSKSEHSQAANGSTKPAVTKDEAINLMQNCKVDYFAGYTDITLVNNENTKSWLNQTEKSSTGLEVSDSTPKTYLFASKAMTTLLQDTARQYRQSCYATKKLYIVIDNWIETEYPAGTWTKVNQ